MQRSALIPNQTWLNKRSRAPAYTSVHQSPDDTIFYFRLNFPFKTTFQEIPQSLNNNSEISITFYA